MSVKKPGGRRRTGRMLRVSPTTLEVPPGGRARENRASQPQTETSQREIHNGMVGLIRVNDPSAGSPTETLLRLLLPLSDKVH